MRLKLRKNEAFTKFFKTLIIPIVLISSKLSGLFWTNKKIIRKLYPF